MIKPIVKEKAKITRQETFSLRTTCGDGSGPVVAADGAKHDSFVGSADAASSGYVSVRLPSRSVRLDATSTCALPGAGANRVAFLAAADARSGPVVAADGARHDFCVGSADAASSRSVCVRLPSRSVWLDATSTCAQPGAVACVMLLTVPGALRRARALGRAWRR